MREIPDNSIKLVYTTPNHEEIINLHIIEEITRVLTDDGLFVLNVGVPVSNVDMSTEYVLKPYRMAKTIAMLSDHKLAIRRDVILAYIVRDAKDKVVFADDARTGWVCAHQHLFIFVKKATQSQMRFASAEGILLPSTIAIMGGMGEIETVDAQRGLPTTFDLMVANLFVTSFTKEGDTVLDPLAGRGSLGRVANENKRNCILYEINPSCIEYIRNKFPSSAEQTQS